MRLTIHRGTHEIGGSCVEIESRGNRIVIDIGMPLVNSSGKKVNARDYSHLSGPELVKQKILPNIKGFYKWDKTARPINGLLISHAHIDHYGFFKHLQDDLQYYIGEGTKTLIDLNGIFLGLKGTINKYSYLQSGKSFEIGGFAVTPFLMDHSAFDAYAFLIEAEGKSIIYSGDFREHGRKRKAFQFFLSRAPKNIDALMLEGSLLERDNGGMKTEEDLEDHIAGILKDSRSIVLGVPSSQNIDRLVTFFKASLRTKRIFAVDVYVANILNNLKTSKNRLPCPSRDFPNIRVFFPRSTCDRLVREGHRDLMTRFRQFKITKREISEKGQKILMMVRPSMVSDLSLISGIESAPVIYSMWEGYLQEPSMARFLDFIDKNKMQMINIHTSGHAYIRTLRKVVDEVHPKALIPIHTFFPDRYKDLFPGTPVLEVTDGQEINI